MSTTAYGSQVSAGSNNWWRVRLDVDIDWTDVTATSFHVRMSVETKYSFNVAANGRVWATTTSGINDGDTSASWSGQLKQGTSSSGATKQYADFYVQYAHVASGDKTLTFKAEFKVTGGYGNGTSTATATVVIPKLLKASVPSVQDKSVQRMGSGVIIETNRETPDFVHDLRWEFKGSSGPIATGVGDSFTWVPTTDVMAPLLTNAEYATCTIVCVTYYQGKSMGERSCTIQLGVPESLTPTVGGISFSDTSTVHGKVGAYVMTLSKIRCTISATARYGATVKHYYLRIGTYYSGRKTSGTITVGALSHSGSLPVTVTVTDSRGLQATRTTTLSVAYYAKPSVMITAYRGTGGDEDDDSTTITARVSARTQRIKTAGDNDGTVVLKYRRSDLTTWYTNSTVSIDDSDDSTRYAYTRTITGRSTSYAWVLQAKITDELGQSTVYETIVDTASPVLDFRTGGGGVGLLCVATRDGVRVGDEMTLVQGAGIGFETSGGAATPWVQNESDARPTIVQHTALDSGVWLQGTTSTGSKTNLLTVDDDNVTQLMWTMPGVLSTSDENHWGLGGRVCKEIWSGTWSSGSLTIQDSRYYNIFVVDFLGIDGTPKSMLVTRSFSGSYTLAENDLYGATLCRYTSGGTSYVLHFFTVTISNVGGYTWRAAGSNGYPVSSWNLHAAQSGGTITGQQSVKRISGVV